MMRLVLAGFFSLLLALPAQAQVGRKLVELVEGPDGLPRRVIFLLPPEPTAAVLLFPGADGVIGIGTAGFVRNDDTFLVRTRDLWRSENLAVALFDTPAGVSLLGKRGGVAFAEVAASILDRLAALAPGVPLFLVGNSQGSTGAASLAANLPPGRIAGLIVTSPISVRNAAGETVFDARPDRVGAPVLVVTHASDTCRLSLPSEAEKIAAAFKAAPRRDVLRIEAKSPLRDAPCGPYGPHGFLDAEGTTVRQITAWMRSAAAKK